MGYGSAVSFHSFLKFPAPTSLSKQALSIKSA
jgi:hypothetical protein